VGAPRRRAHELLAEVGISDPERCLASYPHQLSGGMKQRVVIAAALISDPELIIADEPTTALDVTVQRQVLDLLQRVVASRGVSAILITHDLGVVAEVCDRVAVFYGGMIVEEAATETLFLRPRHPYTAALLDSVPKLGTRKAFKAIPGTPPKILDDVRSCPFQPRCGRALPVCSAAMPPDFWADAGRFRCHNPLP
jgi:oligopeptide/dipeptide ABC transporter ATP-binding protein